MTHEADALQELFDQAREADAARSIRKADPTDAVYHQAPRTYGPLGPRLSWWRELCLSLRIMWFGT